MSLQIARVIGLSAALLCAAVVAAKPREAGDTDPRIGAIKATYADINDKISKKKLKDTKLVLDSMVPGIGDHRKELHFYATPEGQLLKNTVHYAIAASGVRYREFVFDPAGRLLFYYSWSEQPKDCDGYSHTVRDEHRSYFAGGRLVEYRQKRRAMDMAPDDPTLAGCIPPLGETVRREGTFKPGDTKEAKAALADGARYREIHPLLDKTPRKQIQKMIEKIEGI